MSTEELVSTGQLANAADPGSYFRVFVAALDAQGHLGYKDQTSENGPFAEEFTALTSQTYTAATLQAGMTMNGYVAVLAEETGSNDLIYIREEPDGSDRFGSPENLGVPASGGSSLATALIRGCDGLPNVFAIGPDQTIWWKYKNPYSVREETITTTPPGTETPIEVTVPVRVPPAQPWSGWQQLPGALTSMSAVQNADGRIFLTGLNASQVPYLNMQTSDHPQLPEHWGGWQDISGGLTGFEQIEAAISGTALIHVFAKIGSKIYQRVQTQVDGPEFSGWVLLAAFDQPVASFAVGTSRNGGLYLAAQVGTGADSPVYGSCETMDADGSWTPPAVIAHADGPSRLVLQPNADLQLNLFALNTASGALAYISQLISDRWSATWTPLGASIAGFAVTNDITSNAD